MSVTPTEIRELLLQAAERLRPRSVTDAALQVGTLFASVEGTLGGKTSQEVQREVLTQWHDLLRTGYFAWGWNFDNPNPPFFHFTDRGLRAIERLSRDPGNPAGYLQHLSTVATLNPIAASYLQEGLACFTSGLYKAAAVMLGAASESLVLDLRDTVIRKLGTLGVPVPPGLSDWRIKTVLDSLHSLLDGRKVHFPRPLREEFEAYFLAFSQQIRASRNDAGHPSSVDPVTEEGVHASFLIFPELARLWDQLNRWVDASMV